jgi:putative salt-induced outer membrane protein
VRTSIHSLLALAFLASAPALADETGWSGSGELGLAAASGNTDSTSLVGKLGLVKADERWKHALEAAFHYAESDGSESARRYEISGSSGYKLGERSYLGGSIRNERDRFASDEYQWTLAASYGYHLLQSETTHLTVEIGPGYRWAKLQGLRIHNNEAILRGQADFKHAFNETASFYNILLVEAGSENTYLKNDLGVLVKMTGALSLKAGLETRHNTDVLPGTENTDTLTTVNVVYDF